MRKIITPDAWDFQDQRIAEIPLRQSRNPLGPNDAAALSKRADAGLLSKLASLAFLPGEVPIHIIAIGSTEAFGPNRNGDGFREAVLQRFHPTFVKHSKFYRNHKSDDPQRSYGVVKLAHYNARMRRVELIAALNGDEAAARANAGLVADIELRKLAAGEDVPTSMGCMVSYDECSACGNQAKTRADYCDTPLCKAGGLKRKMGQLVQHNGDLHHLHADNPDPRFNDISHVPHQADRTSYVLGVLRKAASVDGPSIVSGAELAEMIYEDPFDNEWKKFARELAVTARTADAHLDLLPGVSSAGRAREFTEPPVPATKLAQVTAALAAQGIVLPINEFAQMISGRKVASSTLAQATDGIFERLIVPATNPYSHTGPVQCEYRAWAAQLAGDYALTKEAIARRLSRASLADTPTTLRPLVKTAAANPLVEEIAQQYGLYVLASLDQIARDSKNFPLTAVASVLQNRVS